MDSCGWNGLHPEVSAKPNVCIWPSARSAKGHRHDRRRQPLPDDWQDLGSDLQKSGPLGLDLPVRRQRLY